MRWLAGIALFCAVAVSAFTPVPKAAAQTTDPNAPYKDAYDVQTRGKLFGTWHGTISGSSISQGDGEMSGQAILLKRGYENRDSFALVLHDHRHRDGVNYSEIGLGDIPCGPQGRAIPAVSALELQNAPVGSYATARFNNRLADTGRDDFAVYRDYAPTLENPASLQTVWGDKGLVLKLSGPFQSIVTPVRNGTFDYERQRKGWVEQLHLDVEFKLEISAETQAIFDAMLCEEPERFEVVETKPLNGRENVILEGADFFVEFSEAVAESSLDSGTVTMTTRGPDDGLIFVDLELGLEDENGNYDEKSLRIAPREPLRSGTIYEISIAGGDGGVRGRDRQEMEEDYTFLISTMVAPEELRFGIYQVSRNAPLVHGKPAAARIQVEWEELDDIHPDWQVLEYLVRAEVLDEWDNAVFPELQRRLERPDQFTDEDRRRGYHTLNLFGWTPSNQNSPKELVAEIWPDNHYPEDAEIVPDTAVLTLDYAAEHIGEITFDYYIAEHSEWQNGADPQQIAQVVQAAHQEQVFANQILPVARVRGRFRGSYNLQDWICGIPGAAYAFCDEEGFSLYKYLLESNPARQAAVLNKWDALVRLFHEHVAAQSDADILVSYHPPSLGGTGITFAQFEQSDSLRRRGDEPYWFGEPDPSPLESLHADRTEQNTIFMSTHTPDYLKRPAILASPLVAHEFGHVFGLPHTPYADNFQHRLEICQTGAKTTAPGIDGMRIALDGSDGWQKSSKLGNAETTKPLLNLMFPCIYEPHSDYWIDANQYDWLVERMPPMLRISRGRRAEAPVFSRVRFAQLSDGVGGNSVLNDAPQDVPVARWLMFSGIVDGSEAMLMPAVGVSGQRKRLGSKGSYELRVEGATGELLARASVGSHALQTGPWPFSVSLAVTGEPSRIALLHDGDVIAERRADPALAAPKIISHTAGATYRSGEVLAWDSGGGDGHIYSVRYTANGEHWTTLAMQLREPRFVPHPATLIPGPEAAFEIIASDGVTEQATRLPIVLDIPLKPLSVWTDEKSGTNVKIVFNTPIDASTLGDVQLETGGRVAPASVRLDPSGMVIEAAPQVYGDGEDYMLTVPTTLRAEDGRSLGEEISVAFSPRIPSTKEAETGGRPVQAAMPESETDQADGTDVSGDADNSSESAIVGSGEITLELGDTITVPARVLRCKSEEDGKPSHVVLDFETTPGDRVDAAFTREGEDTLGVEMLLGNGMVLKGQATIEDTRPSRLQGQQITARGHVGEPGSRAEFSFTGQCPS